VRETITTTALLRLDRSVPVADKLARAEAVLTAVDLLKVGDSRIGNDLAGGISGGERRRLSIGVEVVHQPRLLLLDEPTSGLDATSAQMVGDTLRRMSAEHGTSSLCTIHQPRASLLAVFDVLLLLAEGRTVYFGPIGLAGGPDGVLRYFKAAGYTCPPMENPADWLLDLVHRGGAVVGKRGSADVETGDAASRVALAEAFAARYAAEPLAAAAMEPPAWRPPPLPRVAAGGVALFPTSWWTQFRVLWKRTMLYKLREPAAVMTQASTAVVMPLIVGGIYWRIPLTQGAVSDRLAAVSFLVLMQAFMWCDLRQRRSASACRSALLTRR
jgi:ATP-binding cassette subfamily G (WHITE) protein 2